MLFSIAVGIAMLFRINIDYMFRACVFIGFMEYKIMYCPIHTPYILRNLCCSDYCDLFPRLVMCWENSHVQTTAKQCLHTQQKTSKQQANKFNQTSGRDGSAIAEWFMLLDGTHACSASICMLMPDEQYLGQMQRLLSRCQSTINNVWNVVYIHRLMYIWCTHTFMYWPNSEDQMRKFNWNLSCRRSNCIRHDRILNYIFPFMNISPIQVWVSRTWTAIVSIGMHILWPWFWRLGLHPSGKVWFLFFPFTVSLCI